MDDMEMLAAAAAELAERVQLLATASAEPGDSAVAYLENRAECLELIELVGVGLHFMQVPA